MSERHCPTCGQAIEREPTTALMLQHWCEDNGLVVGAAGYVDTDTAAAILRHSPLTLRNWRAAGDGPPYHRRGRVLYRLDDLAAWFNSGRRD